MDCQVLLMRKLELGFQKLPYPQERHLRPPVLQPTPQPQARLVVGP